MLKEYTFFIYLWFSFMVD